MRTRLLPLKSKNNKNISQISKFRLINSQLELLRRCLILETLAKKPVFNKLTKKKARQKRQQKKNVALKIIQINKVIQPHTLGRSDDQE